MRYHPDTLARLALDGWTPNPVEAPAPAPTAAERAARLARLAPRPVEVMPEAEADAFFAELLAIEAGD